MYCWRRAPLSSREMALAEFASDLTLTPGHADESGLDLLRAAGLIEAEMLETVQIVAIFNATNRLNSGLDTKIEDDVHDALRRA